MPNLLTEVISSGLVGEVLIIHIEAAPLDSPLSTISNLLYHSTYLIINQEFSVIYDFRISEEGCIFDWAGSKAPK